MTEKSDYTGKIRTKGLDHTGFTEDILRNAHATVGGHTYAIVDLKHMRRSDDDATGRIVEFGIDAIYPATDDDLVGHLQQLMKTMHQNKVLRADDAQLQIDVQDDLEPTVEGVIAAGQQHVADTDDELPDPDEDEDEPDVDDQDDDEKPAPAATDEPWEYDEPETGADDDGGRVVAFTSR